MQKKLPMINSAHGSETRNIINELIKLFNGMGYTYDEALRKAHDALEEARQTNDMNKDVQKQVDDLILHAGESDAEVIQARGDAPLLKDRLDKTDSQLADIAVNPREYGAKFDGVSDDSLAIQNTINSVSESGGGEVLLSGKIGISNTIDLKSGVTLNSYNATIIALADVRLISFNRNTKIKGKLTVDVSSQNYTKSAFYFDGVKRLSYRDISIDDVFFNGNHANGMGNAIHFDCSVERSDISFVEFGKVVIRGFEKGIFFDAPPLTGTTYSNYANGNVFNSVVISDCDYYIFASGDHSGNGRNQVDGNSFINAQLQYNTRSKEMVHIEGWSNYLEGFSWDSANEDMLIVNLTETTKNNTITMHGTSTRRNYVDLGNGNHISTLDEDFDLIPLKAPYANSPEWTKNYNGDYEDILHASNLIHSVTVTEGAELVTSSAGISAVFDGTSYRSMFLNLANDARYSFNIVFNGKKYVGNTTDYLYLGLKVLGFAFNDYRKPKFIEVEITSNTGVVKKTVIDMKNEPAFGTTIRRNTENGMASHITSMKITLIGQSREDVRLSRVFASSYYIGGNRFMSNTGGHFVGDVDMNTSYLRVGVKSSMPAPVAGHRGRIFRREGAVGVSDKIYICVKDETEQYIWKEI